MKSGGCQRNKKAIHLAFQLSHGPEQECVWGLLDTVHLHRWWKAKEIVDSNPQDHSLKLWPSLNFILTGHCSTKALNIASKPGCGCVKGAESGEGVVEEAVSVASSVLRPGLTIEEELDWWPLETSCQTKRLFKLSFHLHAQQHSGCHPYKCQHQCCLIALFPPLSELVCFEKLTIQKNPFRIMQSTNKQKNLCSVDWHSQAKCYLSFLPKNYEYCHSCVLNVYSLINSRLLRIMKGNVYNMDFLLTVRIWKRRCTVNIVTEPAREGYHLCNLCYVNNTM